MFLCVCLSLAILALEGTKRYRSNNKSISASSTLNSFFPETTAFKSYGVKTSEKAIMLAPAYLDYFLLGSCTMETSEVSLWISIASSIASNANCIEQAVLAQL